MCGIAGFLPHVGGFALDDAAVAQAVSALSHRGPDAHRVWQEGGAALLHTRLRVLDVSERADQPMVSSWPHRVVMAFNGEVYNYRSLKAELSDSGHAFTTSSDAEVLLAGYQAWGKGVFRRARGMWAVAFWHPDERRLVLSRDPLGKKPLSYVQRGGNFAFASTVTALLPLVGSIPAIDRLALDCYLGHLAVPQEHSVFSGFRKVPPGSVLTWETGREPTIESYWQAPRRPGTAPADAAGELENLLREAVRRRLESDVPLGVFLSAGYDSGLVAAIASQEGGRRLVAVTGGTQGSRSDERPAAAAVASRYGLEHIRLEVPVISAAAFPRLVYELGEPFGDSSILPTHEVARAARREITVALTGDGGDEAFFGYDTFRAVRYARWYRRALPRGLRVALWRATRRATRRGFSRRFAALCDYGREPLAGSFRNRMGFARNERDELLAPEWKVEGHYAEHIYEGRLARLNALPDADALRRTLYETYLPNDYLTKVDTATMASSLEARCPFLDVDLVEFALGLPEKVAFPTRGHKALLRPLAQRLLPPAFLQRHKMGFEVPVADWLRGPLLPAFEEFVLRPGTLMTSIVNPPASRAFLRAHRHGADHSTRLWGLLALGVWCAVVVERRWLFSDPLPGFDAATVV